jgi:Tol biopolymer transport system component
VINVDGTGEANLTGEAGDAGSQQSPAWSPDSRRIAYAHETRGEDGYMRARIISMSADGTDKQPITAATVSYDDQPAWSPNGQAILFVRTGGEHSGDLWLASAAGGNERAFMAADPAGAQRTPAWAPDGKLIAFASSHEIVNNRWGDYQIYTVRADGTGIVRRTSDGTDKQNPAWIRRSQ